MIKFTQIDDLFRAAADIEAETPMTVGATQVDRGGRISSPELVKLHEQDNGAGKDPLRRSEPPSGDCE